MDCAECHTELGGRVVQSRVASFVFLALGDSVEGGDGVVGGRGGSMCALSARPEGAIVHVVLHFSVYSLRRLLSIYSV